MLITDDIAFALIILLTKSLLTKVIIVSSPCAILFVSSTVARPSPPGSSRWIR